MATTLLTTKFFPPPPRAQLVPRARLVERLEQGLRQNCKLILVSAPAGFGKTTLVAETLRLTGLRAAWLSLDAGDNDLVRFWRYAVAAVRRVCPSAGELAQQMLEADKAPAVETVLTSLLNDLAALEDALLLVLDDYHVIELAAIHESLNFLLDHLPASVHVVLTTRADPPLALARRRARLEMVEVRAAELRFSLDDTLQFLNSVMKLDVAGDDVETLLRRTEGWAAGLQMAALAMSGQGPTSPEERREFVASFAGDDQYIGDYLVEEVLQRQPEHVQAFLLQTAILERFNAALCRAVVTGLADVDMQILLETLEHQNLFLVPLDSRKEWFRYHRLFAELLQRRLKQVQGPQVEAALHVSASRWFESQRLWIEAFEHAMRAGDTERAAGLVSDGAQDLFRTSQLNILRDWIHRLPRETVYADPVLCMNWSWAALATGHVEETEAILSEVEQRLGLSSAMLKTGLADLQAMDVGLLFILVQIAIQRSSIVVNSGDVAMGMRLASDVLRCLHLFDRREPYDILYAYETVAYFNLGLGHEALGEAEPASQAFREALICARRETNLHILPMATGHLGQLALVSGRLAEAEAIYREALRTAGDLTGHPSPYISQIYAGLGQVLYERGDLDGAEEAFQHSLTIGRPWNNWESLIPAAVGQARQYVARGSLAPALSVLDEIDQDWQSMYHKGPLTILRAWRVLVSGESAHLAELNAAVQDDHEWMTLANLPYSREMLGLLRARLYLASGAPDEARSLLEGIARGAETGGRSGIQIQALALLAVALRGLERTGEAQAALEQSMALAESAGYCRTYIDLGLPAARLLVTATSRSQNPALAAYAARLLEAFPAEIWQGSAGSLARAEPPAAGLSEPLSEREVEVLVLMAEGLSNSEIAARLYISTGTVKVHANNIYAKLGVNNRTSAVGKARLLGILP